MCASTIAGPDLDQSSRVWRQGAIIRNNGVELENFSGVGARAREIRASSDMSTRTLYFS